MSAWEKEAGLDHVEINLYDENKKMHETHTDPFNVTFGWDVTDYLMVRLEFNLDFNSESGLFFFFYKNLNQWVLTKKYY